MRTIALSAVFSALLLAATPDTPYLRIAKLASSLSDNDPTGAIEAFDKKMPGYQTVAADIGALTAQTEVLCSIDVVADREADNDSSTIHHLDLDWYMMLKSRGDNSVERRRQRVAVTLQRLPTGAWRIVSLTPEQILAPLAVK
jgi:hypothetical protein